MKKVCSGINKMMGMPLSSSLSSSLPSSPSVVVVVVAAVVAVCRRRRPSSFSSLSPVVVSVVARRRLSSYLFVFFSAVPQNNTHTKTRLIKKRSDLLLVLEKLLPVNMVAVLGHEVTPLAPQFQCWNVWSIFRKLGSSLCWKKCCQ